MESSNIQDTMGQTAQAVTRPGWITFAGIMFLISGTFHVIGGIEALSKSDYVVNELLFANLEFWGVVYLVVGGLALYAGYAILNRHGVGRTIGVSLASLQMIIQLMFILANPWWALVVITMDFFILYALVVRGEEYFDR